MHWLLALSLLGTDSADMTRDSRRGQQELVAREDLAVIAEGVRSIPPQLAEGVRSIPPQLAEGVRSIPPQLAEGVRSIPPQLA